MLIGNSQALTVLLAIAADSRVTWKGVELAGRGIAANARSTSWVVSVGKKTLDGLVLGDLIIEKAELIEALDDAWRLFDSGEIDAGEFEARLEALIDGLESWGRPYL
ncbi:hypothetical protein ACQEU3_42935 [Spirillospora sp. CA-253888]